MPGIQHRPQDQRLTGGVGAVYRRARWACQTEIKHFLTLFCLTLFLCLDPNLYGVRQGILQEIEHRWPSSLHRVGQQGPLMGVSAKNGLERIDSRIDRGRGAVGEWRAIPHTASAHAGGRTRPKSTLDPKFGLRGRRSVSAGVGVAADKSVYGCLSAKPNPIALPQCPPPNA
jgi:hypothetical protein